MIKQRTLKKHVQVEGIGVHSGGPVLMSLHPAPADTGVVFRRIDLNPVAEIPARVDCVGNTDFCTRLEKDEASIATVEHLLSALSAAQIDNVYVDLSLPELPILDGSAKPFLELILSAGIEAQEAAKKFIRVKREVSVALDDKWAKLEPYHGFSVSFEMDYNHPVIKRSPQAVSFEFTPEKYANELCGARTFGFYSDYEMLLSKKLAMGSSLENTVVINDESVMNPEGLRYPDEFVKHKILDAIGDLYLLGHNVIGAFSAHKSGHSVNSALLRKLLADTTAWDMVTFEFAEDAPGCYRHL